MENMDYCIVGLPNIPTIGRDDELPRLILESIRLSRLKELKDGDVVVVASKVVSIVEGRYVILSEVTPSKEAIELSSKTGKDPRILELVIGESQSYRLATANGPVIAIHRLGHELTSAGVDNAGDGGAYLLPLDPDHSARSLAEELSRQAHASVSVIVADSDGRADRKGATVVAIGSSGLSPLRRTSVVVQGREKVQEETIVDMIAAAAGVVIGQRGKGVPFAVARGLTLQPSEDGVKTILHARLG